MRRPRTQRKEQGRSQGTAVPVVTVGFILQQHLVWVYGLLLLSPPSPFRTNIPLHFIISLCVYIIAAAGLRLICRMLSLCPDIYRSSTDDGYPALTHTLLFLAMAQQSSSDLGIPSFESLKKRHLPVCNLAARFLLLLGYIKNSMSLRDSYLVQLL